MGEYQLNPGTAYIEGIRVVLDKAQPISGIIPSGKIWLDVCLERRLNDRVTSWKLAYGDQSDYTDAAGARHYCVQIANFVSSTNIVDMRATEPVPGPLIQYLAARNGDYALLRARATTKEDVELGNLPNAISDDPTTNSSQILATTAALNKLNQQIGEPMVGMVAAFAMSAAPAGWLKCNGAAVSRTIYSKLFERISTLYGTGDGSTTFNLPDIRGLFPRAWDDGRGIDAGRTFGTVQDMMLQSHAHTATAATVGDHVHGASTDTQGSHTHSAWTDAQGEHTHTIWRGKASSNTSVSGSGGDNMSFDGASGAAGNHAHNVGIGAAGAHAHTVSVGGAGNHTHALTVAATGGTETRPKNMALLFCIKY